MATGVAHETRAPAPSEDHGGTGSARRSLPWMVPLGAALLLGVFIPLVYAALSGNLGIPHNDTWAFGRSAEDFVHTGHVRMYNWNMMGLAGLVVVAWPVGASLAAQSVFIAVLAVAGLLACYDVLAGALGPAGRRRAAFGTLLVALWPGFTLLSTSFMTDIPAFTAIAATLAFGRRALDRLSLPWLAAACAAGLWGATVREQVLAAPAAILAVALFRARFRADRFPTFRIPHILGLGALLLAATGLFELWRRKVPGGAAPDLTVRKVTAELVSVEMMQGLLIVALAVSPAVFAMVRPRRWSWPAWTAAVATVAAGLLVSEDKGAFLGNYVNHDGAYSAASAAGRPILLGSGWWMALACVAYASAALLVGSVVDRVRTEGWGLRLRPELLLFAVATVVGTLMEIGGGADIYDRYLIPMAIPVLALVLSEPLPSPRALRAPRRIAPIAVAAGMVTITGATLTVNAFTFDMAVWNTASRIVASGQAGAEHVDAGLVWDGYHSPTAMSDHADRSVDRDYFGALRYLPNHFPCYVVSPSPRVAAGWSLVSVQHYKTYGFIGDAALYVFRVGGSQTCS
ncbi:hypothetical protein ABIA35_001560 [Catenulispora sp. MAP12-49]|uniref:hypothetical protein n=1 Tax=Catenulispora sp. MAP12-49 TaxID=3156302 RepID=UPI0035131080